MDCATPKAYVLIVDDDPSLRWTTSLILECEGYPTDTAANGAEAIERVQERPYDVVLMDLCMPVLNGVQALKQIKALRPQTVVVMMTAYAVEDLIQDALGEGAFAILDKPVDIEQIIAVIEESMAARQSALILIEGGGSRRHPYVTGAGEPRTTLNAGADAVHCKNPFLPETHSAMAASLRVGGQTIGTLDAQSTQKATSDAADAEILQGLADQLTMAIERTPCSNRIS